jgi:hypothetical protein
MTVVDINNGKRYRRAPRDLVPLDKTSGAARFFDRMVREIEADLNKRELTRIEQELIRAFCGAATQLQYLNGQILLGDSASLDLAAYSQCASTMLRIGSRLGLSRRQQLVPGLHETGGLLDQLAQERAEVSDNITHLDNDDGGAA